MFLFFHPHGDLFTEQKSELPEICLAKHRGATAVVMKRPKFGFEQK